MTGRQIRRRALNEWPADAVQLDTATMRLVIGGVTTDIYRFDRCWCAPTQAGTFRPVGWLGVVQVHEALDLLLDAREVAEAARGEVRRLEAKLEAVLLDQEAAADRL